GEIALGVDDHGGNAVDGGFLQEADAQAGLARAGHADDDTVRGQVAGVVHDVLVGPDGLLVEIVLATEVEAGRLFTVERARVLGHGRSPGRKAVGSGLQGINKSSRICGVRLGTARKPLSFVTYAAHPAERAVAACKASGVRRRVAARSRAAARKMVSV